MTGADKTKLIQYLQVEHSTWLAEFNNRLATAECVSAAHDKNIKISNLIKVLYRYLSFDDIDSLVEDVYVLEFNPNSPGSTVSLTLDAYSGGPQIADFDGSYSLDAIVAEFISDINNGSTYNALQPDNYDSNTFILYSTVEGALPSAPILTGAGVTLTTSVLSVSDYDPLLPIFNCITEDEKDDIVCRITKLLKLHLCG